MVVVQGDNDKIWHAHVLSVDEKTKNASFTFTLNNLTSIVEKILAVLQGR